jgi:hypothetical protein
MWSIVRGKSGSWYIEWNRSWYDGIAYDSAESALIALRGYSPSAANDLAFKIPRGL